MTETTKPLIVVLGLGDMGMVHATNLAKVRHIRLGLACKRPDVLETAAAQLCADATYATYDAALTDTDVTAVVISTAPATHPTLITRAAQEGKHIFSEKPLGEHADAIRAALTVVKQSGIRFVTGFMRRWDEAYVSARRRVASGRFGKPVVIKCTSGDAEFPDKYQRDVTPHAILKDLAVHDIDLARWYTSSEVTRAYALIDALTYPQVLERGDGDLGIVVLEMATGTKVTMHLSRALRYGYNVTTEVVCTDGTFAVGDLGRTDMTQFAKGRTGRDIDVDFRARFAQAFQKEMAAFAQVVLAPQDHADTLLAKDDRFASADDGLKASIVADALVRSVECGNPVDVVYE